MNKLLIFFLYSMVYSSSPLPDFDSFEWNDLYSDEIFIEYYYEDKIPWCKAYTTTDYSIDKIADVLENKENYPSVFDRITKSVVYDEDIVYIKLDMPFPWASRDYIVKYFEYNGSNVTEYSWSYYDKLNIPLDKNCVRLVEAAGKWRLTQLKDGKVQIEYIWNGELLGDFPKWALKKAWKEQGREVLGWLIEYMDEH